MSISTDQVDELRGRLSVDEADVADTVLERCLQVAEEMLTPHVPTFNRAAPGYLEGLQLLGVRVFEERARGRVGVDPAGEFDVEYTPGPTAGMVRSVWAYIGPLAEAVLA